jgi:protein-disulfide isomerase
MSTTPTKRVLREQRRAARREAEQAQAARETRRRRAWQLGAVVAVAAVAVVIAAAVSSSGGSTTSPPANVDGAEAAALFRGIPERNGVLGDPDAPLTLTEFVDLQCPFCAQVSTTTLPTIVNDYVRSGKVKLEARTLHFIGPDSTAAAQAAAGAERQGKLWPFLEVFYANQGQENSGYVTEEFLRRVAADAGVDADRALAQANGSFAERRLDRATTEAGRLGVDSTPTLVVSGGGRAPHVLDADPLDPQAVSAAVDRELGR